MTRSEKEKAILAARSEGDTALVPATVKRLSDDELDKLYADVIGGVFNEEQPATDPKTAALSAADDKMPLLPHTRPGGKTSPLDTWKPQGGNDFEKIGRSIEDTDTEYFSRLADRLNNRLYMDPSVVGLDGYQHKGGATKFDPMELEDKRLQDKRRDYESTRRTWNEGMPQSQAMFEQNMRLMGDYRKFVNDLIEKSQSAEAVMQEQNTARRGIMYTLLQAGRDQRGLIQKILNGIFEDFTNSWFYNDK